MGQRDHADQEPEQEDGGDAQGCEIDRTALPQFTPHRPVQRPRRRQGRGSDFLRVDGRAGHGVGWSAHRVAPWAWPVYSPTTATYRSAMLGVPTLPSAA